jgi:hypothetical protein
MARLAGPEGAGKPLIDRREQVVGVEPDDSGVAHRCVTATLHLLGGLARRPRSPWRRAARPGIDAPPLAASQHGPRRPGGRPAHARTAEQSASVVRAPRGRNKGVVIWCRTLQITNVQGGIGATAGARWPKRRRAAWSPWRPARQATLCALLVGETTRAATACRAREAEGSRALGRADPRRCGAGGRGEREGGHERSILPRTVRPLRI